jgi:integrase
MRWGEQRERALLTDTVKEVREVPTLADFEPRFVAFSENNNKPSTVYAKRWLLRCHILPALGKTRLDAIGPPQIEDYKSAKVKEGLARKSINNHLACLGKMLHLAEEWGVIEHAPKVRLFRVEQGPVRFLTFGETPRFLAAVPEGWRTFALVALKTGLRVGELLALKWDDLDLAAGRLIVRRTLWKGHEQSPKGGRSREVPLSNDAVAALKAHRHLRGPYVFCDDAGGRLTHSMVKDVVPAACKRAALAQRLTTHDLRHTFASHLVMRGVALKAVQELLGHATIEMTMRYAHLSPDVKRDAVQLLDAPVAPGGHQTA